MAPSKKAKSVNKRFSSISEVASKKDGHSANKSGQRKRKLSDMLGPQWSKHELERFYEAYRKYGKDWKKVAAVLRNRTVEMVEALYTMNRAYLSLPEGTASVVGLVAMMTDHYCILGGSDSEQESNDGMGASRKPQKRAQAKLQSHPSKGSDGSIPDLLQFQSAGSNHGCLSLLKKRRSGSRPRAVGRRTPRIPVLYSKDNGERYFPPIRQGLRQKVDASDDDVAHEIALALTEASHRGGSPQVSRTPKRKTEMLSPVQSGQRRCAESEMTSAKPRGSEVDDGDCELSSGSTRFGSGDYARDKSSLRGTEGAGTVEVQKHTKRYYGRKPQVDESVNNHFDDIKEACSGTEEGQKLGNAKGKFEAEVFDAKSARTSCKGPKKRSKKILFAGDEGRAFDALQTLADLSLLQTTVENESFFQKEEVESEPVSKSELNVNHSIPVNVTKLSAGDARNIPEGKKETHQVNVVMRKRRQKSMRFKSQAPEDKGHSNSHLDIPQKVEVPSTDQVSLPTKARSKRKSYTAERLIDMDLKSFDNIIYNRSNMPILKEKLSHCLSWYQLRRWCVFEWFYSAIDYPWFAKREFVEYLDHLGLGHVPRLTHIEWGVIRSSLGKPRRLSERFLKEEKERLNQYRETVRAHYTELRAATREGLPTDLARPLSVGQRVIAVHPKTKEIHDGSVLTVDHDRCRVQFDQPELGVEFVMDINCMPLHPLENLPASLTRHNVTCDKVTENLNELKMNGQPKETKMEGKVKLAPCEKLENTDSPSYISPSTYHISNLLLQPKGGLSGSSPQAKVEHHDPVDAQQPTNSQPSTLAQIQAKEADVQALAELTRALDKKEAVVSELRQMNNEVLENEKDGDSSLKNSESLKKQYAAVLLQLNEVNEQVSSALFCLRQRNTYQENSVMRLKPMVSLADLGNCTSSYDRPVYHTQEYGSQVAEIVESSRTRAQTMVDAAMQAMSLLEEENSVERMEEAIDFVNNQLSVNDFGMPAIRSSTPAEPVLGTMVSQEPQAACTSNPLANSDVPDHKLKKMSHQNEGKIPSELIARSVATLLMIRKCTERHFPPGDVAQVLDYAVTSLQPCCSQNLPIYAEIQKCMGIIRNQILALIPT
ncbi:Myb_DNA-binding domain-containing protein/DIRP domain-containing protein [Cephalotus follicularis]|uniref:Myb_DNA-binding domain-containing protein/DIRP domain-containing protein n=1 Tax=Cephalotus follicularis TaxID=3775 RepID=A0A1Q3BYR0_CEPFO|nr:Myb_DNA-binding domain-containing protein/DIRP domain-containing protein [Cephalotus follicularis]